MDIWTGLTAAGPLEQAATLLGILGVWLMIRESLWAFPVGLFQVVLSAFVFHQARLYADRNLQAVFFIVLAYGWWHWMHPDDTHRGELVVGTLSIQGWVAVLLSGLAGTGLWGWYLVDNTDAVMPYRDAFISTFSILAQWLQSRKKLENWHLWILVNATAVPVYWLSGLHWFAFLYFLFLLMAIGGLLQWRTSLRGSRGVPVSPSST